MVALCRHALETEKVHPSGGDLEIVLMILSDSAPAVIVTIEPVMRAVCLSILALLNLHQISLACNR